MEDVPTAMRRLSPADALYALDRAGIALETRERMALVEAMHAVIRENQEHYRALSRRLRHAVERV